MPSAEDRARWARGDFTKDEIAKIKAVHETPALHSEMTAAEGLNWNEMSHAYDDFQMRMAEINAKQQKAKGPPGMSDEAIDKSIKQMNEAQQNMLHFNADTAEADRCVITLPNGTEVFTSDNLGPLFVCLQQQIADLSKVEPKPPKTAHPRFTIKEKVSWPSSELIFEILDLKTMKIVEEIGHFDSREQAVGICGKMNAYHSETEES